MLRAVCYLHSNHIIHRDLKAENWLLVEPVPLEKVQIKLVDFGTAKRLDPGQFLETKIGTPYYVAPEVIAGKYTNKADMWSLGIVLHMLITGVPPFGGKNTKETLEKIKACTTVHVERLGKSVSPEGKKLLTQLVTSDSGERLCAADALQKPWFPNVLKNESEQKAAATRPSLMMMKDYGKVSKLEKVSLAAVASQMSREAIVDLEQAFIAMDENGDGTLSLDELRKGMNNCGIKMDAEGLQKLLESIDTDGSGAVDYSEFIAATMDQSRYIREDACYKAFKVFDLDGSGFIDKKELSKLIKCKEVQDNFANNSIEDVDKAYADLDMNDDGKIDFDEFMAMMYQLNRTSRGA